MIIEKDYEEVVKKAKRIFRNNKEFFVCEFIIDGETYYQATSSKPTLEHYWFQDGVNKWLNCEQD